eukprot:14616_1
MNYKIKQEGQFNAAALMKCYYHIINTHLFCLSKEQQKSIRNYVRVNVGQCTREEQCVCLQQQSESIAISDDQEKLNVFENISISQLNSLHCYLLHDASTLRRIRRLDSKDASNHN